VAVNCTDGFTTREDCAFTDEVCEAGDEGAVCTSGTADPSADPSPDAGPDAGGDGVELDLGPVGPEITVVDSPDDSETGCGCGVASAELPWAPALLIIGCLAVTRRRRA